MAAQAAAGVGAAGGTGAGGASTSGLSKGGGFERPRSDSKPQGSGDRRKKEREGDEQNDSKDKKRWAKLAALLLLAIYLLSVVFLCIVVVVLFHVQMSQSNSGSAYPSGSGVPPVYWPMYLSAADYYRVSPYLLASIHYQETRFSTAQSSKGGFNSNGCCAGPMQFNVKGGTWGEYEDAFRPIEDERPVSFYPSDRRRLPSCQSVPVVHGCVYDDFDAIAAAADLLHKSGADPSLYSSGTHKAVCSYIGACSEVDGCTGSENEYCEVLPRARKWEQVGLESQQSPLVNLGGVVTAIPHTPAEARALPGLAVWEHERIARWIIPYLIYARAHGWHGEVRQGYRTYAEEVRIARENKVIHAAPGHSNHGKTSFPGGAVDVTESERLSAILRSIPGGSLLKWAGSIDVPHFSYPHDGSF